MLGIGIAAYFWFKREELGALKGLTQRNKLAHAGYTFLVNKYYLDVLYEDIIVGVDQGRRSPAAVVLGQPARDRRRASTAPARGARVAGKFTYEKLDQKGVDGAVNGLAESPARAAASCATSSPAVSSATRCCCSVRWGSSSLFLLLANS